MNFDLPVFADADVVVVGGGPSGVAAALSAARAGVRVLLIERMGFLGGTATAAQVPAFAPFSDRTKAIVRGIGWEVMTEMQRRLGRPLPDPNTYDPKQERRMDWVPIAPETLKVIYDELCETAGVRVLFHTFVGEVALSPCPSPNSGRGESRGSITAPEPETPIGNSDSPLPELGEGQGERAGRIQSLILANKSGLGLVTGKVFIDATGDADIAARAGCPFVQGDDEGRTQGMTLCFTVAQGNRTAYLDYVYSTGDGYLTALIAKARAVGDYDLPDSSLVGLSFKSDTIAGCNLGHVYGFDATNAFSVSDAEREARRVVQRLLPFLRKYVPGQENLTLVSTGPHIGVRESRRIVGDYTLTLDDYLASRTFPDDIARCAYFIDLHAVTTAAAARAKSISDAAHEKSERRSYALAPGESHGIPYRCLIPQGVENLLVAGRSLSAERAVQGAARVIPYCFAMGEAAGLAAAIASVERKGRVRDVDSATLRTRLLAQGAWLG